MLALTWIAFPALAAVVCLGCGLLVDRLASGTLPRVLLVPTGFAAALVLATSLTVLDATAELAAPAVALAALTGIALALVDRRRGDSGGARDDDAAAVRRRTWVWPLLAAALPAAAIAAPVVLTGQPGLTGYGRIVDLAFQLDLAAHVVEHGRSLAGVTRDSSHGTVIVQLLEAGYPTGVPGLLGSLARLGGIDPIWAWQPFMAVMGGLLGLALYALLRRAIARPAVRALAAGVAAQPTILFSYALASGIKELAAALLVALLAALLAASAATADRPGATEVGLARRALPAGLAVAAGLCAVNVGFLPWALVLLAVLLGPALVAQARSGGARRRIPAPSLALALALAAVVAIPTVLAAAKLAPLLRSGGPQDLGNLAAPLPAWSTFGPWLTPDHRYPLAVHGAETATALLALLVALLALLGLARAARSRDVGVVAAGLAAVLAVAVTVWRGSAWVELKAFTISAPLVVALAFAGAAALVGDRRPLLGSAAATLATIAVAGAILAGNALVYQSIPIASHDRLAQLERLGRDFAGQGPALHTAFDEYAGYLMRDAGLISPVDELDGERPADAPPVFARDLDTFTTAFLERFRLIVVRRGDMRASRPPADFRLARRTRHYDVYRRVPAPAIASHIPLDVTAATRPASTCETLRADLRRAGPGARVAYVPAGDATLHPAPDGVVPEGWLVDGPERLARGAGRMRYAITVDTAGSYELWLRGSFGRRVMVTIDDRPVGSARWASNYPLQYEPLGTVRLSAGEHVVDIVRGGGTLLPGTGNDIGPEGTTSRIGPLALIRAGTRPAVRTAGAAAGLRLCAGTRPLDWLAVVRAVR